MQTEAVSGTEPEEVDVRRPEPDGGPSILVGVATFLTVSAVAALSSWLVLSYQVALRNVVPIGADTPSHLWRTRIVHALGLRGLFGSSPFEYHANSANPDRIGLPALGSLFGATVQRGAVATDVRRFGRRCRRARVLRVGARPRGGRTAVGGADLRGGRGWSIPFAITARSHLDNALVDALIVALAAVVIRLSRGEAGVSAGVALAVGAVLMHWPVGLLFVGILGLFAVLLLPSSRCSSPGWRCLGRGPLGSDRSGGGDLGEFSGSARSLDAGRARVHDRQSCSLRTQRAPAAPLLPAAHRAPGRRSRAPSCCGSRIPERPIVAPCSSTRPGWCRSGDRGAVRRREGAAGDAASWGSAAGAAPRGRGLRRPHPARRADRRGQGSRAGERRGRRRDRRHRRGGLVARHSFEGTRRDGLTERGSSHAHRRAVSGHERPRPAGRVRGSRSRGWGGPTTG